MEDRVVNWPERDRTPPHIILAFWMALVVFEIIAGLGG